VISPTTIIKIICIKVGETIRIKVLNEKNAIVQPTDNLLFNNNHFILPKKTNKKKVCI